jgi:hypothetical protein
MVHAGPPDTRLTGAREAPGSEGHGSWRVAGSGNPGAAPTRSGAACGGALIAASREVCRATGLSTCTRLCRI